MHLVMRALARPLAHLIGISTAAILVVGTILWARSGFATPPYVFMRGPVPMLAFLLAASTQLASGWIIAYRRPDLPIGRLGLAFSLIISLAFLANGYLALGRDAGSGTLDGRWVAWLPNWMGFSAATLIAVTLGLIFPDGRLGARWRWILVASVIGAVLTCVALALLPGPLVLYPSVASPVPTSPALAGLLRLAGAAGISLMGIGAVSVAAALAERYQDAGVEGRLQLRWYIATALFLVVGFLAFLAALVLLPNGSMEGEIVLTLFILAGALPPIALFASITRYRLYDIDTLLSRAFVYGTLTAILAGLYTASIRLFNSIFSTITGESSDLTLVFTTLVLATSFTPIKRRLEAFVEHRFRAISPAAPGGDGRSLAAGPDDADALRRALAELVTEPSFVEAVRAALGTATAPSPEPARAGIGLDEDEG
jgi:hypothetical protein